MKISRVFFLSLSLLFSVPLCLDGNGNPAQSSNIDTLDTTNNTNNPTNTPSSAGTTTPSEGTTNITQGANQTTPPADSVKSDSAKNCSTCTLASIKDSIAGKWSAVLDKTSLGIASVAAYSLIKGTVIGTTLLKYKDGISKAIVLSATAVVIYGAYKAYTAMTKKDDQEVIDFDMYTYEDTEARRR